MAEEAAPSGSGAAVLTEPVAASDDTAPAADPLGSATWVVPPDHALPPASPPKDMAAAAAPDPAMAPPPAVMPLAPVATTAQAAPATAVAPPGAATPDRPAAPAGRRPPAGEGMTTAHRDNAAATRPDATKARSDAMPARAEHPGAAVPPLTAAGAVSPMAAEPAPLRPDAPSRRTAEAATPVETPIPTTATA